MLREYHFSFDELLQLELRRFWFLYAMIDRLRAEDDLRTLSVLTSATSNEAFKAKVDLLSNAMGEIFVFNTEGSANTDGSASGGYQVDPTKRVEEQEKDPAFDRDKFNSLRAKFASGQ